MQVHTFGRARLFDSLRSLVATACIAALVPGDMTMLAQTPDAAAGQGVQETVKLSPDQLDSLVAPIALYPDPLLSQSLVASTYPLEIIQLQQWLAKNKTLKDKALADAVKKQDWDPSIQALAALPDAVKLLSENIQWTTDLGNAFLAQQNDVMDAVQRMRKKAKNSGNLKSTEQQKIETKVVESKEVIIVEQANPQVIYVPSYNPTVVYGAPPAYPYPPVTYPPPGYYAAGVAISFGVGMMMGAFASGGWGWNCGWGGHNNVYINHNNTFVNNSNRVNNVNRSANRTSNTWQHNPQHRGGAPYSDRATAKQYGGTTRGDSLSNRQATARRDQAQRTSNRQQAGVSDRSGRTQQAAVRDRDPSGSRNSARATDRSTGGRDTSNRGSGGDRVGNRSVSSGGGGRDSSAFGGGGGGFNGGNARASSSRGSSSMGSGGASRGGGGRRR